MNRRWMAGLAATVLMTAGMVAVGVGAYRAGERRAADRDVEFVGEVFRDGESVGRAIIVDGDGWFRGPGFFFPGFVLFPLIAIAVFLLVRSRGCGPGRQVPADDAEARQRRAQADEARSRLLPDR